MMFTKFRLTLGSLMLLTFFACKKEIENQSDAAFDKGLLVVNEGLFQTGKGTISWIDPLKLTVAHEVFESANNGQILGNVAQSASYDDDHFYIAINNSAKIVVANRTDFTFKREITDINQVRYTQSAPGSRLLASAWGDGFSGSFFIFNNNGNQIHRIDGLKGPERFIRIGEDVFLTCSGGFGNHDRVVLIDIQQGIIKDSFLLSDRPESIVQTDGQVFVLCSGKFDFLDPQNNTDGAIFKYNGSSFDKITVLPNGSRSLVSLPGSDVLYFLNGTELGMYHFINGTLTYQNLNLTGINGLSGIYWNGAPALAVADAKDYISRGEVILLDGQGQLIRTFEAGNIPGQVVLVE